MSGGFEPDEEDEQEEEDDDDAVLAELAISKTSPIRNLPIDLPHDSPNSSPTRQSARIRKHTLLQHDRSRPIPSPTRPVPVVKDSTTSRPTSTISQSRPVSSFKPMSIPFVAVPSIRTATPQFTSPLPTTPTRTRTRALVATQTRPATTELPRTAAGTVTDALTSTTKSPSRNSKSKKKVYSKEIVLPLLHSLLPHLSGTKPLPIQFPNTDSVEMNDKRMVLNEIECLVGLDETELELRMVLNRTVVEHEGNVLLLCGGRGSGKTAVVNRTLSLFKDPRMHGQNSFITIRLNGLIQTNDKLALREMSRQLIIALNTDKIQALGTEEEQEELMIEDGTRFNTNAKTLKNLIHLLEPPLDQEEGESEVSKALVIVLEEFDRFTQLDRQAFLYTLLDIVQGNKRRGGICVIGTTAVVDCLDRLEKRVKSRCQSRIQYLFSPRTLIERKELIKSLLYLQNSENEDEENEEIKSFIQQWNDELDECLKLDGVKVWLENVFGLISDGIPKILQELNKLISTISYKLKTTKTIEFPILSNSIPFKTPKPSAPDLRLKPKTWWNDSNSLSTLELSILIGAKHLSQLYESRMFNLEMCWDSYRKHLKRTVLNEDEGGKGLETLGLLGKGKGGSSGRSQVYGRDAFEMGWERLINLEILLPIKNQFEIKFTLENHNSLIGKRFDYVRLILFLTEIDELIENRLDLALHLKRWCKNWSD
ncbi:origin recognition complex subunit 4 C-terminus-domain-containing protein [Melampsora americana]|nr:origin recognition complex subunit 4 C-terminus-domain-containing protein [Melampsora americana]